MLFFFHAGKKIQAFRTIKEPPSQSYTQLPPGLKKAETQLQTAQESCAAFPKPLRSPPACKKQVKGRARRTFTI